MKSAPLKKAPPAKRPEEPTALLKPGDFVFHLPPGANLSDMFMDGQQVMQQLNISPRTLRKWRRENTIPFTSRFGKIYYLKQEIAALLLAGKKEKTK